MTTTSIWWWTISAGSGARPTSSTDLLDGQYKNPIGIFSFNSAEGWSRDVSADIAAELRQRGEFQLHDVPDFLRILSIVMTPSTGRSSRRRFASCDLPHEMHRL
jgi:hypothetical protein